MQKINVFKLADNSIMYLWLIDRIASGYNFDIIREMYKIDFNCEISEDEFNRFRDKYNLDIENRYTQMRKEVYDSGTFGKLTSVASMLYDTINNPNSELSAKEIAQVSDTLRKYLETLGTFGKAKSETKKITNNNFLVFESLEAEGLITINNKKKVKYLVDGVEDSKEEHIYDGTAV